MRNLKYKLYTRIKAIALSLVVFKNKILSRLTTKQSCKIVMILGYQRSGTSAMISSFENCKNYTIHSESNNSWLMHKWLLRPEKNIRYSLNKRKRLITKPITESYLRTSGELFEEYKNYDVQYILLLRNVENIFYSNSKHDNESYGNDIEKFIPLYNKRMNNTLTGLDKKMV
ncbi:sulfotransferase domain-containing protein [Chitinophagales bacterium]|nr:sulfotransferase domain-containing protein [Chitinophagales bacterium]